MKLIPGSVRQYVAEWFLRGTDPAFWRTMSKVRRGHILPNIPRRRRRRGEVWAIAMVKNEADIIESFVRHLFSQGVHCLLLMDNGSTDLTWQKVANLAAEFPIYVGRDTEFRYYQAHKMSRLAWLARKGGADWVVPMDADEFWFAEGKPLAQALRDGPGVVRQATVHNAFPTRAQPTLDGLVGSMRLDCHPGIHGKMCARTFPGLWVRMGNHQIERPGLEMGGLHVLHLPWRSRDQFVRKAVQGAAALDSAELSKDKGRHWRELAQQTEVEADRRWESLLDGHADPDLDWSPSGESRLVEPGSWTQWPSLEGS